MYTVLAIFRTGTWGYKRFRASLWITGVPRKGYIVLHFSANDKIKANSRHDKLCCKPGDGASFMACSILLNDRLPVSFKEIANKTQVLKVAKKFSSHLLQLVRILLIIIWFDFGVSCSDTLTSVIIDILDVAIIMFLPGVAVSISQKLLEEYTYTTQAGPKS